MGEIQKAVNLDSAKGKAFVFSQGTKVDAASFKSWQIKVTENRKKQNGTQSRGATKQHQGTWVPDVDKAPHVLKRGDTMYRKGIRCVVLEAHHPLYDVSVQTRGGGWKKSEERKMLTGNKDAVWNEERQQYGIPPETNVATFERVDNPDVTPPSTSTAQSDSTTPSIPLPPDWKALFPGWKARFDQGKPSYQGPKGNLHWVLPDRNLADGHWGSPIHLNDAVAQPDEARRLACETSPLADFLSMLAILLPLMFLLYWMFLRRIYYPKRNTPTIQKTVRSTSVYRTAP